jgi:hypothetical protein
VSLISLELMILCRILSFVWVIGRRVLFVAGANCRRVISVVWYVFVINFAKWCPLYLGLLLLLRLVHFSVR